MPDPADYVQMMALDLEQLAKNAHGLAAAMRAAAWEPKELPNGTDIARQSIDGTPLFVGDRVQVIGSDRYGDPYAIVRGAGPDLGDGKQRVHVELEDGQNAVYTPSAGRVRAETPVAE
jgi:hypothetical protein